MPWSLQARVAGNEALLGLLQTGTGDAVIRVLAGATTLVDWVLDHAACAVDPATATLTLVPVSVGATAVASGTATSASILARDGAVMLDGWAVAAGVAPTGATVVISSLNIIAAGQVDLLSASVP